MKDTVSFFFKTYKPKCRKCRISHNVEESFKKLLDPNPEADYFQNSISSCVSTDTWRQ